MPTGCLLHAHWPISIWCAGNSCALCRRSVDALRQRRPEGHRNEQIPASLLSGAIRRMMSRRLCRRFAHVWLLNQSILNLDENGKKR